MHVKLKNSFPYIPKITALENFDDPGKIMTYNDVFLKNLTYKKNELCSITGLKVKGFNAKNGVYFKDGENYIKAYDLQNEKQISKIFDVLADHKEDKNSLDVDVPGLNSFITYSADIKKFDSKVLLIYGNDFMMIGTDYACFCIAHNNPLDMTPISYDSGYRAYFPLNSISSNFTLSIILPLNIMLIENVRGDFSLSFSSHYSVSKLLHPVLEGVYVTYYIPKGAKDIIVDMHNRNINCIIGGEKSTINGVVVNLKDKMLDSYIAFTNNMKQDIALQEKLNNEHLRIISEKIIMGEEGTLYIPVTDADCINNSMKFQRSRN